MEKVKYNPETGEFFSRGNNKRMGNVMRGEKSCGYRRIGINNCSYLEHRLAWLYMYGDWPDGELDHINRDRGDNRISNIRLSDRSKNMANSSIRNNNRSGIKGIYWDENAGKWGVSKTINKKRIYFGLYKTISEAKQALIKFLKKIETQNINENLY